MAYFDALKNVKASTVEKGIFDKPPIQFIPEESGLRETKTHELSLKLDPRKKG